MFDLFVVVYENDYPLLKILAHSVSKFCQSLPINQIVIVENSNNPTYNIEDISLHFGNLARFVKIVRWQEIYSGHLTEDGYVRQQVLKLIAHKACHAENIVILDAKNFFIKEINEHTFINDGKLIAQYDNDILEGDLPCYPLKKYVFDLFNIDMSVKTLPIVTPFLIKRKFLEELEVVLLSDFNLTPDSFFGNFVPAHTNEFYPMQSHIISKHGKLEDHYFITNDFVNSLWDRDLHLITTDMSLSKFLTQSYMTNSNILVSGIHRRAIIKMNDDLRNQIIAFWVDTGICNIEIATDIINDIVNE